MLLLLPHPIPFMLLLPRALPQETPAQESQSQGTGLTHRDQEWAEEADWKGVGCMAPDDGAVPVAGAGLLLMSPKAVAVGLPGDGAGGLSGWEGAGLWHG